MQPKIVEIIYFLYVWEIDSWARPLVGPGLGPVLGLALGQVLGLALGLVLRPALAQTCISPKALQCAKIGQP